VTLPTIQAARTLGLQVQVLDVSGLEDVDPAFQAARAWDAGALLVTGGATFYGAVPSRISELAAHDQLPTLYHAKEAVTDNGGLMAFFADNPSLHRLAAEYVDKILRGARPADLPVQEPRQFDFIVNVKAAQALGITFPPDAAAQVTQWIQ
jgi:putative ABC transport system substrate-binding protein